MVIKGTSVSGACAVRIEEERATEYRFYCKLFNDMIIRNLCHVRRQELNSLNSLSCRGCSKDIIICSPHRRSRLFPA